MSVVSNENKEMLWDLIIDICNDNSFKVNGEELKQFLDNRCGYYHGQRFEFSNYNLNDINKQIIGQCYNFILSKQEKIQQPTSVFKEPVNKREMFDKDLAAKQKAFEEGITLKKPKEIDFSDGSKDFPMDNLGVIMNQTLADRQKELEQITSGFSKSQQEEAAKWLNNGETAKIKIGENIRSVENEIIKPQKKVRFEIKESGEKNAVTNFFSKLKVKKENNNDIIEKLDKIISNQEKIIKLLEKNEEEEIPGYEAI